MNIVTRYESENGKIFEDPFDAMREDIRLIRDDLARTVKFITIAESGVFQQGLERCRMLFVKLKTKSEEYFKAKQGVISGEKEDIPDWLKHFEAATSAEDNVIPLRRAA